MATGKRIKGITIELDGETKGLEKALSDVNKKSNSLKGELKDVERLLKFDPGNVEALSQKQKLLSEQVKVTGERLEYLKKAEKDVQDQFQKGKISEQQYRNFRRELEFTEGSLNNLKQNLNKLQGEEKETERTTGKLQKAFKDAGREAKDFGNNVKQGFATAGVAAAAGVGGLVTGMQDFNQDLGRLRTNAAIAGRDLETVEKAFLKITEVTGETDSAVETLSNLLASGFTDNQLEQVINEVNGAAIKFSDTLKTEGIADGIQETFATGKAIGPFAELLERSGIKLEDFNEKLAAAKKEGEGANFILETLADQGFSDIYDKYVELNPEVQANAEATANFQKALADLAITLTPLVVFITELITKVTEWAAANPTLTTTITAITVGLGSLMGIMIALSPVITAITALAGAMGISITAATWPILAIIAAIAATIAIGVALYKNWDTVKEKAGALGSRLSPLISVIKNFLGPIGDVIAAGVGIIQNWDNIMGKATKLREKIANLFTGIKWDLPDIKLPHFKLKGKFSLTDMTVPTVGVDWYKNGGLFPANSPRVIGIGDASVPEMALPLSDKVLGNLAGLLSDRMGGGGGVTVQQMIVRSDDDIKRIARELHNLSKMAGRRVGTV